MSGLGRAVAATVPMRRFAAKQDSWVGRSSSAERETRRSPTSRLAAEICPAQEAMLLQMAGAERSRPTRRRAAVLPRAAPLAATPQSGRCRCCPASLRRTHHS